MSEENKTPETPETTEPDTDAFDISAWLSTGDAGRVREIVEVYNDVSLVEEARKTARELDELLKKEELGEKEDLAVGEKSGLTEAKERYDSLLSRINKAKGIIEVVSLSDKESEHAVESFRSTYNRKMGSDIESTCWALAAAATFNGKTLTAEQWFKVSEAIAGGQWEEIKQAHLKAQRAAPKVSDTFLRNGSRLSQAVTQ